MFRSLLLAALPFAPDLFDQDPVIQGPPIVHHALCVVLEPDRHRIEVVDEILVPPALRDPAGLRLRLHAGLDQPEVSLGFDLRPVDGPASADAGVGEHGRAAVRSYLLRPAGGSWPVDGRVRLAYAGAIHEPLVDEEQEYARSFARSPGLIDPRGVVLSGSSFFVPEFGAALCTFELAVELPDGWTAVSQGERLENGPGRVVWRCAQPMDEVFLIAARWTAYERPAGGGVTAQVFLREPEPNLAAKYLEATARYLEMYARLIGPYPFAKFALVENFWETGYGMPSFTLLGPQVIRLPFILQSSYPHEILHNWWGNSVFVDAGSGNWCEGLTAYLADHLLAEGQGRGIEHRRDTLKRYRDHVRTASDFPLTEFRSRHSSTTEAVGYGKALMLFHMLRVELGDARFVEALRAFYREQRFRRASWADLEAACTPVAGGDLGWFFAQWVERTGAPELALAEVEAEGNRLRLTLRQVQEGGPYQLRVPVAVSVAGREDAQVFSLVLDAHERSFDLELPAPATCVQVDPAFDLFRRLDRSEIPPSIGQLFGAARVTVVLPGAEDPLAAGWRAIATSWTGGEQAEVVEAAALERLPDDSAVWVLGTDNRWAESVRRGARPFGAQVDTRTLDFGAERVARADHAFVLTAPHPADPELAIGWIGADRAEALPGLGRKLPHYGKYSFLAFAGAEPQNDAKGQWTVADSPLSRRLVEGARPAPLPAREPLARPAPAFDAERMREDVAWLADDARTGRGVGTVGLDAARDWIAARFAALGLEPTGDEGTFLQHFVEPGGPDGRPVRLANLVGLLRGTDPALEGQSVVVGAHYDHLGRGWPEARAGAAGAIHNGADDNASGVAVLLEVARVMQAGPRPRRSLLFVAFSAEEWDCRGSAFYVRAMRNPAVTGVVAMLNLDTVGRLGEGRLQVLGTGTATEWPHIVRGVGFTTGIEAQAIAEDPGGSDQRNFVACGVPAVQLFTGAHEDYHRPTDDLERIDAAGMVAVATFAREVLDYLGGRQEPLTVTIAGLSAAGEAAAAGPRRASLGTLPDFGFAGPGVKIAAVTADSAAEAAGIVAGDLLLAIDGTAVADLRSYAELLRACRPGQVIELRLRRGAGELVVEAELGER
jgi:hypothetical protein